MNGMLNQLKKNSNMEKHTKGLKDQRSFYKNVGNGQPYELIAITTDNDFVMKNLITGETGCYWEGYARKDFIEIERSEVFDCIDNNDDRQHADMMRMLGIGYICPFCGGTLHWESDFMASEVNGMCNEYIEIKNPSTIQTIKTKENELIQSGSLGVTNDITEANAKVVETGYYDYMYMREDKKSGDDIQSTYYEIDDTVIGIYTCSNCGKHFEIQDCLPSEEENYAYFSEVE